MKAIKQKLRLEQEAGVHVLSVGSVKGATLLWKMSFSLLNLFAGLNRSWLYVNKAASPAGLGSVSLQALISSLKSHFCDPCLSSDLNPRCLVLKNSLRVTLNLKDVFLPAPAEHWWRVLSGFEPATSVFLFVSDVSSPHRKGVRASSVCL